MHHEIRVDGTELLTRDAGTAVRADIATLLATGASITVNLDGITDITPSVADEAFGKLSQAMGIEEFTRRISFVGGSPLTDRLIDFVLKLRNR